MSVVLVASTIARPLERSAQARDVLARLGKEGARAGLAGHDPCGGAEPRLLGEAARRRDDMVVTVSQVNRDDGLRDLEPAIGFRVLMPEASERLSSAEERQEPCHPRGDDPESAARRLLPHA